MLSPHCSAHAQWVISQTCNFTCSLNRNRWLYYFKRDDSKAVLPSPEGIQAAKKSMGPLLSKKESGSRGRHEYFTEEYKAVMAKRACEVGITNAKRALATYFPGQWKRRAQREWKFLELKTNKRWQHFSVEQYWLVISFRCSWYIRAKLCNVCQRWSFWVLARNILRKQLETMEEYITMFIKPYVEQKRSSLKHQCCCNIWQVSWTMHKEHRSPAKCK